MAGQAAQAGGVWEELERLYWEAMRALSAVRALEEERRRREERLRPARAVWPRARRLLEHPAAQGRIVKVGLLDGGKEYEFCGRTLRVWFGQSDGVVDEDRLRDASDPDLVIELATLYDELSREPAWTAAEVAVKRLSREEYRQLLPLYYRLLNAMTEALREAMKKRSICEA